MRTRSKARRRAVEALFEAEQRGVSPIEVLERNPEVNDYAVVLVHHVTTNGQRIDELVTTYLTDRTIDRMPALDRAITRVAVGELLFEPALESAVIISEAVEIAELLSTEQSSKYINGLLGSIARVRENISSL